MVRLSKTDKVGLMKYILEDVLDLDEDAPIIKALDKHGIVKPDSIISSTPAGIDALDYKDDEGNVCWQM